MFGASPAAAEKPVGEASMTGTARSAAAITLVNRIEAGDGAMDPVAVDQVAVDVAFLDRAAVDLDAHARSGAPRMEELILEDSGRGGQGGGDGVVTGGGDPAKKSIV